ncbi:MAG: hypothetical protein Kow00117_12990 [Phototrophicales bacterium]
MAKRKSSNNTSGKRRGRKSRAEARVERTTWFLMVLVFAVIYILPEGTLPNPLIPFSGAVILLGAGVYQFQHGWRVPPTTWIFGTIMLMFAAYNVSVDLNANFYGVTLLVFAIVLGIGALTGET